MDVCARGLKAAAAMLEDGALEARAPSATPVGAAGGAGDAGQRDAGRHCRAGAGGGDQPRAALGPAGAAGEHRLALRVTRRRWRRGPPAGIFRYSEGRSAPGGEQLDGPDVVAVGGGADARVAEARVQQVAAVGGGAEPGVDEVAGHALGVEAAGAAVADVLGQVAVAVALRAGAGDGGGPADRVGELAGPGHGLRVERCGAAQGAGVVERVEPGGAAGGVAAREDQVVEADRRRGGERQKEACAGPRQYGAPVDHLAVTSLPRPG